MKKNLTKKQIHKASALELIFRMNCLHGDCKRQPEDDGIPKTDLWEATRIVKELRYRLGRLGIFYMEIKNEK